MPEFVVLPVGLKGYLKFQVAFALFALINPVVQQSVGMADFRK